MPTPPPKPEISSELRNKLKIAGAKRTYRTDIPHAPPSLILPHSVKAAISENNKDLAKINNYEKENKKNSQNNKTENKKTENKNNSKLERPTKKKKKLSSTIRNSKLDSSGTLRAKSGVPGVYDSLRNPSGVPSNNTLRGTLRNSNLSVNPLVAKSGIPGKILIPSKNNSNTLRGNSGVPTLRGMKHFRESQLIDVPLQKSNNSVNKMDSLRNSNNIANLDNDIIGFDPNMPLPDDFDPNMSIDPDLLANFDPNMPIDPDLLANFDPNMPIDPDLLANFDPNMPLPDNYDPNMPLPDDYDPNMPLPDDYDPNMPLPDNYDPNMPLPDDYDPNMVLPDNTQISMPNESFNPSSVMDQYDTTLNNNSSSLPQFDDYEPGTSVINGTYLPPYDPDDIDYNAIGTDSYLPPPPSDLNDSDGEMNIGPKTRKLDFGDEDEFNILNEKNTNTTYGMPERPKQMPGFLKPPEGLMDTELDTSNLFAVSPNMLTASAVNIPPVVDDYSTTGIDSYDSDNIGLNMDENISNTPNQPGVIAKNDKLSIAKTRLSTIRNRSVNAGKIVAKKASVVAEQADLIENSKVRAYVKKIYEQIKLNDPTLAVVSLSSCRLTKAKLKELNSLLTNNTVVKKIDLSNRGIGNAEASMSSFTKGLIDNKHVTMIDVSNNNIGLKAALAIEKLLKVNLNLTRFDVQERVFQAYDRALLAHTLKSIQWLLNSNYSYQAFKFGKSTDLILSGRNFKQLVTRLLEGAERVQYFDISYNELDTFPIMIEEMSQVQQFIANHNLLTDIPGQAIVNFDRLMKLDLSFNKLIQLPDELCELVNVQELQLSNNEIEELPEMFRLMQSLKRVDLSDNKLTKLPTELSNLSHLEILLLYNNFISEIPESLFFISSLKVLNMKNNKLTTLPEETPNLPCIEELDLSTNMIVSLPEYFGSFKSMRRLNLSFNKLSILPAQFTRMTNMELLDISNNLITELPDNFGNLWRMIELYAQNNKLTTLPTTLQLLRYLKVLDLCNNRLKVLDHFLCTLISLHTLRLYKNEPLKGLSSDILEKAERYEKSEKEEKKELGAQMVLNIVKKLPRVTISVNRIKLMIVGKQGVGKSCLYESLVLKHKKQRLKGKKVFETNPTQGIQTTTLKFKDIYFHTWDFSGDEQYYSTHQLFLSDHAIYLLVCNMMDPESEDERIEQWLELITRKVNDHVPIILIGTHLDEKACKTKVRKAFWNRMKEKFFQRFPNIIAHEGISAKFNKKTDAVLERVLKIADKQSYIPQQVMRGYQYLEDRIALLNGLMKTPMTSFKRFSEEVIACGVAPDMVKEAMKYLNDAGIIVYFGDVCSNLVFLDPQWIVELLSSFNQIKQHAKKGMVERNAFESIWNPEKYPIKYHEYILMLLERFDMLMRLKEQGKIFFPELLEEEATPSLATLHMMWAPGYEMEEPEFRRNIKYQFIPNTLFARIIGKIVHAMGWNIQNYWKNGSILEGNGGGAFIKLDPNEKILYITVRGELAGNDLTTILNTIEQLNSSLGISDVESFVPCTHCLLLEEDAKPFLFPISEFAAATQANKEYVLCEGEVPVKLRALIPKSQIQ